MQWTISTQRQATGTTVRGEPLEELPPALPTGGGGSIALLLTALMHPSIMADQDRRQGRAAGSYGVFLNLVQSRPITSLSTPRLATVTHHTPHLCFFMGIIVLIRFRRSSCVQPEGFQAGHSWIEAGMIHYQP